MAKMSDKSALPLDRRALRSRAAILSALNGLLQDTDARSLSVAQIVDRAGVGRSTFYQHFDNIDDLVRVSIGPLFDLLASHCLFGRDSTDADLLRLLEHFWSRRRLVRQLFAGHRAAQMGALMAESFVRAQKEPIVAGNAALRARASFLAGGATALLQDWLTGRLPASPAQIAQALMA